MVVGEYFTGSIYNIYKYDAVLQKLYDKPQEINEDKKKDLMDLCHAGIIPAEYHRFFENLTVVKPH